MAFTAQNGKTPLPLDPIAWWHFNDDAHDATNHGFDGAVPPSGVSFLDDEPVRGKVADFNNTQAIPIHTGPNASEGLPTVQITVSGWVKVDVADTWGGFIGCLQDNGSYERGWVLGTRDQKFSFALVSANTNSMTYLTDTENFNLHEWYYVTATYNGSAMKLFVNGELKATSLDQSGDIVYAGLASDWFGIGSYVDENENWLHDGALDELIIWARALPDAEVHQWYLSQSNLAPAVSIVAPVANSTYIAPASITITAEAQDTDGTIGVVEFFNGTQKLFEDTDGEPYTFTWENVPAGVHTLTAKASDNLGSKSVSAPVDVIVLVNAVPTVSIVEPADNSTFQAPADIAIIADALDSDGSIALVEFFEGANKIGEDADGAPYVFDWNAVPAGTYSLHVRATDDHGAQTMSAPIAITVDEEVATHEYPRAKTLRVAPNPTGGGFRFLTDEPLDRATLRVYTAGNQLVLTQTLLRNEADLGTLPAGAYFLEIETDTHARWRATIVKM